MKNEKQTWGMVGVHSKAELNKEENRNRNNKGGMEKEMQKK